MSEWPLQKVSERLKGNVFLIIEIISRSSLFFNRTYWKLNFIFISFTYWNLELKFNLSKQNYNVVCVNKIVSALIFFCFADTSFLVISQVHSISQTLLKFWFAMHTCSMYFIQYFYTRSSGIYKYILRKYTSLQNLKYIHHLLFVS